MRFAFVLFLSFLCPRPAAAETSMIDRIQKMRSSLVEIKTVYTRVTRAPLEGKRPDGTTGARMVQYERSGTGLVIDPKGLVVTNTHIIIHAPQIFVVLADGKRLPAEVAFVSPAYDFSFLKIRPPYPLKPVQWADPSQTRMRQKIIAMGNSGLNSRSMLSGEINSIIQSRSTKEAELIGVDLNLYRGDSGGPIWDREGRLLGIVMAKSKTRDRAGFAIASGKVREQYLIYKRNHPS